MTPATFAEPVVPTVFADLIPGRWARDAALIAGGAGLVGVLAQISIPLGFTPVPMTMQTLGVLLVGTALGARRGAMALIFYALVGLAGMPWFAGGASGLVGANFGFILGFIVSAAACGRLAEFGADRRLISAAAGMMIGELVMYAIGVTWLALDLHVGAGRAIALGLTPFLVGDLIKAAIASLLLPGAWRLVRDGR